jgi:probable F420-dependent oxidoreductase
MKVRIGVGLGAADPGGGWRSAITPMEDLGFDSLWLAEILTGAGPDPLVGLAWAAATTTRLKLGTTLLGVGRNPVRLAGALADVDQASGGRLLLTLVPGLAHGSERAAVGALPQPARAAVLEDAIPLLRRLWAGEVVTHDGPAGRFSDVRLGRRPHQDPLEPWLGGMAPAALERCGRLADGWLPSACTPAEAAAGRTVVDEAAAGAGRRIDPEHFGVSIAYAARPLSPAGRAALERQRRGHDIDEVVPVGPAALRERLEAFVEVGFSKFVVRPLEPMGGWASELGALADAVLDLQT